MPALLQATGLVPVYHPSGIGRETAPFYATTWNGTTASKFYDFSTGAGGFVYKGTPVGLTATGQVTVAAAAGGTTTASQIYGVFWGAEYNDPQGRRTVSTYFNDSFISTTIDPQVWFWILTDNSIKYEIQVNGALAAGGASVGDEFNFSATSPNRPQDGFLANGGLGYSTTALANTPIASGTQGQVRCIGLGRSPLNAWSDAFPTILVELANTSSSAPKPAL